MPVRFEELRDRVLGCLTGLAVGDALGAPHRLMNHYSLESRFPEGIQDMLGGGKSKLAPGQWTAPTAQALVLIESIFANKGFEGIDIAMRLSSLVDRYREGFGFELREVLEQLGNDPENWESISLKHWYHSGGTFAGNGGLSRCVPIALTRTGDLQSLVTDTTRAMRLTHYDPRCVEAAIVVNFLILQCLYGQFHGDATIELAGGFLESLRREDLHRNTILRFDPTKFSAVSMDTPLRSFPEDPFAVSDALKQVTSLHHDELNVSQNAVSSMTCAVWALHRAKNFAQGVSTIVTRGGECDKNGALTGALLGARFGLSGIPKHWLAPLHDRARLVTLTEQILPLISMEV